jgi:predicted metal-binding membrane protein
MTKATPLERIQKRERALVLFTLISVTGLAWLYLIQTADMEDISGTMAVAMSMTPWGTAEMGVMFLMWVVMMVGMMLPGAAPMVLLFSTISRKRCGESFVRTGLFILGYIIIWTGFSLFATALQDIFHRAAFLSPMMESTSPVLGAGLFIAAGLYQWTPLKHACLKRCRSPLDFILFRWRRGVRGALLMGLEHGAYCLGCCGLLMGLLFVGGVMNLVWIASITLFVVAEKLAPGAEWLARVTGLAMIAIGICMLVARA